jgi:hypothetical protein
LIDFGKKREKKSREKQNWEIKEENEEEEIHIVSSCYCCFCVNINQLYAVYFFHTKNFFLKWEKRERKKR